jgi:hypothetical protein
LDVDGFSGLVETEKRKRRFEELWRELPSAHRNVLSYFIPFLRSVAKLRDLNLMAPSNLAIIFGPLFMRVHVPPPLLSVHGRENKFLLVVVVVLYDR